MRDWRSVPSSELPEQPKCKAPKPSEGTAYCGDTCNCGYKEVKRRMSEQTVLAQIANYERRWGRLETHIRADMIPLERIREALDKLPDGPWEVWTSCSFRRISRDHDGDVLRGTTHSDGQPDLSWNEEQCQAICDVVNCLRDILRAVS